MYCLCGKSRMQGRPTHICVHAHWLCPRCMRGHRCREHNTSTVNTQDLWQRTVGPGYDFCPFGCCVPQHELQSHTETCPRRTVGPVDTRTGKTYDSLTDACKWNEVFLDASVPLVYKMRRDHVDVELGPAQTVCIIHVATCDTYGRVDRIASVWPRTQKAQIYPGLQYDQFSDPGGVVNAVRNIEVCTFAMLENAPVFATGLCGLSKELLNTVARNTCARQRWRWLLCSERPDAREITDTAHAVEVHGRFTLPGEYIELDIHVQCCWCEQLFDSVDAYLAACVPDNA